MKGKNLNSETGVGLPEREAKKGSAWILSRFNTQGLLKSWRERRLVSEEEREIYRKKERIFQKCTEVEKWKMGKRKLRRKCIK